MTVTPPDTYTANVDNFQFAHLMAFTNFTVKAVTAGEVSGTEKILGVKMEAVGWKTQRLQATLLSTCKTAV